MSFARKARKWRRGHELEFMKREFVELGCDRTTISHIPADEKQNNNKPTSSIYDRYNRKWLDKRAENNKQQPEQFTIPCSECRVDIRREYIQEVNGKVYCNNCNPLKTSAYDAKVFWRRMCALEPQCYYGA